ncbi:MAG: FTR1 family protein [Candidatus Omnitrophica bacterium]|nr:FTR1 family protein [Candidatus Omnitrophota bacterium]
MADGTVMATLVIVFREALEAGLIVGIILTVMARLRAMRYSPAVWLSVAAAVGASFLAGWGLSRMTQAMQGRWETIIEGVISLAACGVLTYMVFWMDRQARRIRPEIETRIEAAVSREELSAFILLPFLAVFREGAETVLFLKAVAMQSSGAVSLAGGLLGASLAVGVTAAIFLGGRRVPLKPLFQSTGVLLLLIAAGLLAYGLHELEELGWVPGLISPVWNINHMLNEKEGLGAFLKALFGYNGNPSLTEVAAYLTYLAVVLTALRRRMTPNTPPPSTPPPSGGSPQPAAVPSA